MITQPTPHINQNPYFLFKLRALRDSDTSLHNPNLIFRQIIQRIQLLINSFSSVSLPIGLCFSVRVALSVRVLCCLNLGLHRGRGLTRIRFSQTLVYFQKNRSGTGKTLKIREICVIRFNSRFSILLSESRIIADDTDRHGLCYCKT